MYESPINLYTTDLIKQVVKQQEELILKAVQSVAVDVNHEELFRALKFDRDQYEKGYRDAIREKGLVEVVRCKDCVCYKTIGCAAGFGWCEAWDSGRMDNDFCSHGTKVGGAELEEKAKPAQEVDFDYNAED